MLVVREYPKKLLVLYFYTFFTPTVQYFYTDISAISVTFRNSAGGPWRVQGKGLRGGECGQQVSLFHCFDCFECFDNFGYFDLNFSMF